MDWSKVWLGASLAASLNACAASPELVAAPDLALEGSSLALTPAECEDLVFDVDRSLVVHDSATLTARDFSLERTLQAIIDSSGAASTATPETLLQSLLGSYTIDQATNDVSGLAMPVDVRSGEASLAAADLLDPANTNFMRPVALFNRLDLAPASAETCGEHRIVYAKTNTSGGRFFLIFEAALPNPDPAAGIAGCEPVAEFWAQLSNDALFPNPSDRADQLEDFYYAGLPGFDPVVQHSNYGVPFGQVRSNHFINFVNWQLREWRTSFDTTGEPLFVVDTVKQTPLAEFFDSTFTPGASSPLDAGLFASEQALFQADFLSAQVPNLAAPELSGTAVSEADVINGFGSAFPARFDEFQSHAQSNSDNPRVRAASGFNSDVAAAAPAGISADQILNRAGVMTCGGCHQFSNSANIGTLAGNPVRWPNSAGFVHVSETGFLSDALRNFFLPARMEILREFACNGGGTTVDPVPCGGPHGDSCETDEFCKLPEGQCGGDVVGVCEPRPGACGPYGGQVCGCDGTTYPSSCAAHEAGVSVEHTGACELQCSVRPLRGCCFNDTQCGRGGQCARETSCGKGGAGVCKSRFLPRGQCWDSEQCRPTEQCVGASICGCGQRCFAADRPGTCRPKLCIGPRCSGPVVPKLDPCLVSPQRCILPPIRTPVFVPRPIFVGAKPPRAPVPAPSRLELAVRKARAAERAQPGAFTPSRRVH